MSTFIFKRSTGDMQASVYDPAGKAAQVVVSDDVPLVGQGKQIVAITAAVDMKVVGDTALFTVPNGKKFKPEEIYGECTEIDAAMNDGFFNFGYTAPNYNDLVDGGNMGIANFTAVGEVKSYSPFFTSNAYLAAGTQLFFRVSTVDGGTALKAKLYLEGFLIDA